MIDRDTARRRFEAFLDAMETYEGANSDEARAAAEDKVLAARAALDGETGIMRLRQRRMVAESLGHSAPGTVPREADDFGRFIGDCLDAIETPSGRQRLRHALARHFLDDKAVLTASFAHLLTEKMLANAKGLLGALDPVERASGVDSSTGLANSVRIQVVGKAGYAAGVEFGPNGRIPHKFWERVARDHAELARTGRARGHKIRDANAGTIKSWCQKGNLSAGLFNGNRLSGADARAKPDPSRMLTAAR